MAYGVTSRYDVMMSHMMLHNEFACVSQSITKKGLFGKRTVQFGKRRRYVNAQAFSYYLSRALMGPERDTVEPVMHGFLAGFLGYLSRKFVRACTENLVN